MNAEWMITVFLILDELCTKGGRQTHKLAHGCEAEVLTVAVVAARYFQNHQERALLVLRELSYLQRDLSVSRFNRRLHALADWLELGVQVLTGVAQTGEIFIIDSLPVPVCKRVRARRCRKVRGLDFCGYCAAKKEKFFGWRLHLICTPQGRPVSYTLLAGRYQDLTPSHELTVVLPPGVTVYGDKGYISAPDAATILKDTGGRLIAARRTKMEPYEWTDEMNLKRHRKTIETVNSQMEKMGLQRLYARTNEGFEIKVHASLFALS
ncbi:MAG: IS982 family transposase, partial [Blastocatellia bacterium]|nr:IS982 family transposase [Blastocatellia bacterium]